MRKHPQNGPSFSRATFKAKPLTNAELAERQAREKAREAEIVAEARNSREFWKKNTVTTTLSDGKVMKSWRFW